jgi:signal transduction histidine kinase/CHASE3 domain sensor protein
MLRMNPKAFFASFRLLKIIFIISLLLIILISALSYKHINSLSQSAQLVVHTHKVQIELEQLMSYLKDAETGQRGFLITKDSIFLQPFNSARSKVNESFNTLKTLTTDNPKQQTNLDSLYVMIDARFKTLAKTLLIGTQNNSTKQQLTENMLIGKNMMDKIRLHITSMNNLENEYLTQVQKKYEYEDYLTPVFALLLSLFSILVFILSYLKINKDLKAFKIANEKLTLAAEATKHAEVIGNFSSWQWNLETNKLIYSDNQYGLLGCQPQSFEPTIDKYLEFVHPDDKHVITEGSKQVMDERGYPNAFFRIIRKDGVLRYIHSVSRLLTDENEKKILIGVNMDVTEAHLNSIQLNEINRELTESNAELSSFNHVASHDLQEPLRKIETFISRIKEDEMDDMSEAGKGYFAKIETAASRMRQLINDLLLFSRANKAEKIFTDADLNVVLKNVTQEMAQSIEEKKAIIQAAPLPILAVISFQIQQLFTNLISNSLKYCKPGAAPLINIECAIIMAKESPLLQSGSDKQYYKISFTDNGLGFEQQYAENIFMPFKRLHETNAFPGTGIGLSICKKIIENHSGFIYAEGKPGIGATFTFFLPA